jgi:hypothetical protein
MPPGDSNNNIPPNGGDVSFDYYCTIAWMWDTQDVVCPPHTRMSKYNRLKKFEIMGYGRIKNPRIKKIKVLLEVQKRTEDEAIRQGKNYAKMMGYEFSHVVDRGNA